MERAHFLHCNRVMQSTRPQSGSVSGYRASLIWVTRLLSLDALTSPVTCQFGLTVSRAPRISLRERRGEIVCLALHGVSLQFHTCQHLTDGQVVSPIFGFLRSVEHVRQR